MAWYLGTTTTRQIEPHPGAEKTRGEFAVLAQLRAMGIDAHAPAKVEFIRQGKRRRPDPVESPILRGYIFANIPDDRYYQITDVKGLSHTLMRVAEREVRTQVMPFLQHAQDAYDKAQRIIAANDRTAMVQYSPGDALTLLSPALKDQMATFIRMVETAHDMHPILEVEMDMMGRKVLAKVDPLDVKAAE